MAKTDRGILVTNDQSFGQIADPNKLETMITHAYDKIDENVDEFTTHKDSSDHDERYNTKTEITTLLSSKTDKTGNHEGTWQGLTPSSFDSGQQAINLSNLQQDLDTHEADTTIHITSTERTTWNNKQDALPVENRRKISFGTSDPAGGVDGDIYFQYV